MVCLTGSVTAADSEWEDCKKFLESNGFTYTIDENNKFVVTGKTAQVRAPMKAQAYSVRANTGTLLSPSGGSGYTVSGTVAAGNIQFFIEAGAGS